MVRRKKKLKKVSLKRKGRFFKIGIDKELITGLKKIKGKIQRRKEILEKRRLELQRIIEERKILRGK